LEIKCGERRRSIGCNWLNKLPTSKLRELMKLIDEINQMLKAKEDRLKAAESKNPA